MNIIPYYFFKDRAIEYLYWAQNPLPSVSLPVSVHIYNYFFLQSPILTPFICVVLLVLPTFCHMHITLLL